MNPTYEWFLGFAVASIGFGPWLLVYYLRTQRLLRKSAGKDAVPAPAPTPAPPGPCTYHLTDGRWCLFSEGHNGRHNVGTHHRLCDTVAQGYEGTQNILCTLPRDHQGPHAGIDVQRRLRLFSFQDMTGTQISEPVLALPKAAQEALAADVAPAAVPSENPPSDP